MNNLLYYLACPYSHPDKFIVYSRVLQVNRVSGLLFKKGIFVFSPISMSHPMHEITANLGGDWTTWATFDELMVSKCEEFLILPLAGWQDSTGVKAEIKIAKRLNKRIRFVDPETCDLYDKNGDIE